MSAGLSQSLEMRVPLREESTGAIRVGNSRVLLDLVIHAFQAGATPEDIVRSYDTLELGDVYAVISYYLANTDPVDDYLRRREQDAQATRKKIEASQPDRSNLREILLTRAKAMEQTRAKASQ
jgi:uncharacterized protein (DUF433 family)